MQLTLLGALVLLLCCQPPAQPLSHETTSTDSLSVVQHPVGSWPHFLQNLPLKKGPILDFTGHPISEQDKHVFIINYDVGSKDLQQCADAIMRLRAEYLFAQKRSYEIGFHFTDGTYYGFRQYCEGKRPYWSANKIKWRKTAAVSPAHASLRSYLDIVYSYAGTISLEKELKTARGFGVGTVVIRGGSPGHCFIIVNEAIRKDGTHLYMLAEGYTPAQSIYILARPNSKDPWYTLQKGPIETSSYQLNTYKLGSFE